MQGMGFFCELQDTLNRPLSRRFTIRDIMLWTAIVALIIGLYKLEPLPDWTNWITPVAAIFALAIIGISRALRSK